MRRFFRVTSTGQWCAASLEDARFFDDGQSFALRLAVALGLQPGVLEVVDAEADPREGDLLLEPAPPSVATARETARATARADLRNATTIAQLKAALEVLLG